MDFATASDKALQEKEAEVRDFLSCISCFPNNY